MGPIHPQAILFDFDGVIVESVDIKTEAFRKLFAPYGDSVVEMVVRHHERNGGVSRYEKLKYYSQHFLSAPLSCSEIERMGAEFSKLVVDSVVRAEMVQGALPFLERYYQKVPLFVVSGTPQEELRQIVFQRGLNKYFRGVFGSPHTKVEIVNRLVAQYQFERSRCIFVGDSLTDYESAQETALRFIGRAPQNSAVFPGGTATVDDLTSLDTVLSSC